MATPKKGLVPLDLGPTGLTVADAVHEHRQRLGLSYSALEQRLDGIGHRIHIQGLRRIEAGARRVDVDDLMALAAALETSPTQLLTHQTERVNAEAGIATGVPDDLGALELFDWVQGRTTLAHGDRVKFNLDLVARLTAELDAVDEEVRALRAKITAAPRDAELLGRAHASEGRMVDIDRALSEAAGRLERLQQVDERSR